MKNRKKSLFSIFLIACLDNFGFGMVFILFPSLILSKNCSLLSPEVSLGNRNLLLGILFAVFPLTQLIGAPLIGNFADCFGRKKAFYVTILATTLGYLFSYVAIELSSVILLLLSRVWTGFFSGNLSICLAAIADLSEDEKQRARNYGMITFVFGVSWPAAMLVGGYFSDPQFFSYFTPALPFALTALLSLSTFLVVHKLFHETYRSKKMSQLSFFKGIHDIMDAFSIKKMRLFFSILFFWTLGWGISIQWYGAYDIEQFNVTQERAAWDLIMQGIFWTFGSAILNPILLKKRSIIFVARLGFGLCALFLILASLTHSYLLFSNFYWIAAIFSSFSMSSALNLVSISSPREIQGNAMGLSQSVMSFGWFLIPLIAGVIGKTSIHLFYPLASIFMSFAFLAFFFKKNYK